ncbi:MAG: ExbD/TolR family protein [Prochlorothrix sp.]
MRFKSRQESLPEINLVPMLDVLMTVLTFFILISMSMTGQAVLKVTLPSTQAGVETKDNSAILVVGIDREGQLVLNQKPVALDEVLKAVQAHLATQPDAGVMLKADKTLTYSQVAGVLEALQQQDTDRITIAASSP